MHELIDRTYESLTVGQKAFFRVQVTEADFKIFKDFALDSAPVHSDVKTAKEMGYPKPIAYGFMVFSRFSGLLGMNLPGPRTVIHSSSYKMKKPVFIGDTLDYHVQVKKLVASVRVVFLDLKVSRADQVILVGETQCGFLR